MGVDLLRAGDAEVEVPHVVGRGFGVCGTPGSPPEAPQGPTESQAQTGAIQRGEAERAHGRHVGPEVGGHQQQHQEPRQPVWAPTEPM